MVAETPSCFSDVLGGALVRTRRSAWSGNGCAGTWQGDRWSTGRSACATGSYCGEGETLSKDGESSDGAENASSGEGFNTTMSTRRFLARPSGESLEATG